MAVNHGVVEVIQRFPALAWRYAIGRKRTIEIVRAIDMARIAHIVIVTAVAGSRERIVTSDRILNDLDQRLEMAPEGFRGQARSGVAAASQGTGDRCIERTLDPLVELTHGKTLEISALPTCDVDNLDKFTRLDEIGGSRGSGNSHLLNRIAQGIRQKIFVFPDNRLRPLDQHLNIGRYILPFSIHDRAGGDNNQQPRSGDLELCGFAGF